MAKDKGPKFFDTEKSKEKFFADLRNTVGYAESKDRAEFIKGASVAYDLVAREVDRDLGDYINRAEGAETRSRDALYDLETLAGLIRKYAS